MLSQSHASLGSLTRSTSPCRSETSLTNVAEPVLAQYRALQDDLRSAKMLALRSLEVSSKSPGRDLNTSAKSTTTNPASSGPAGPVFEGQVAAYYLLSLLTGAQPRGLIGTKTRRVELQRASEGHPLDDVIVHAESMDGALATLAIQVKRSIAFTPTDPVFRSVVAQIAQTVRNEGFWSLRYELAIAVARTSRKIDGAYQDVLSWARELESAETFFARLARPRVANDDMRRFVQTFCGHLAAFGGPTDDQTVWKLLARLQILTFDFTATGSATQELATERAAHALHSDDAARAGSLWGNLIELAILVAATGGERARDRLVEDLHQRGFRLAGQRSFSSARAAL